MRGTVGAECRVIFDYSAWYQDFHTVTVVFKRYDGKPINILARGMEQVITIPHEILATSGSFRIGVFGVAENIVTPTLWSDEIKVEYGTETNGTAPEDYTPTEIEQIKTELGKNKIEIDKKQDKLTAGKNITIDDNNVISATGGGTAVNEKWEKIVDFTVQEESVSVKIDKDLNGNDFNLKKAYIKTKILPAAEQTSKVLVCVSTDKDVTIVWGNEICTIGNCPINTENYSLAYVMAEKVDNEVVITENRLSVNYTNIPETLIAYGGQYTYLATYNNVVRNKIDCLFIGSYRKVLGVGTHFEMWGVRE